MAILNRVIFRLLPPERRVRERAPNPSYLDQEILMSARARTVACLVALAAVLAVRDSVFALPEALTKAEIGCQAATNKALPAYGKARTACVAGCQKKTPLAPDCSAPFGGKTLECVQKADAKLAALLAKKCTSDGSDEDACPECYEQLNGSCAAFGTAVTTESIALTDDVTSTVFCDDSGSPDGLTKAEAKCQKAVVKGMTAFVASATKCATACLKNERKGKTNGTCNPAAFLFLTGDEKTVACLFKAFFKLSAATSKCEAPAGDTPECLTDLSGLFTRVENGLSEVGGDVNVCPAQCGDEFTQGLEQCDPPGSVGTCPGNAACSAQCTCT
jgi:hypothetical protein